MIGAIPIIAAAIAAALLVIDWPDDDTRTRYLPKDRSVALVYVALGDSTVTGMGASSGETNYVSRLSARLRSVYPQAQQFNLGMAGATSSEVARHQLPQAVSHQPQLVTLSVGPNDIVQGKDVDAYEANLETIFGTLHRETPAVVVANLLPDLAVAPRFSGEQKEFVSRQTVLFNEALRRQANRFGVQLVDLYTRSQEEVPDHAELIAGDDWHPSDAGYARWAELMWNGVEARIA